MTFNKEKYWSDKANNIASKRPKAKVTPPATVSYDFEGSNIVVNNRARRRLKKENNVFRKKGFIAHLNAIKVVRKKNNKTKVKLFFLK